MFVYRYDVVIFVLLLIVSLACCSYFVFTLVFKPSEHFSEIVEQQSPSFCGLSLQKPSTNNHVRITNVVDFSKNLKTHFDMVAVASGKTEYVFLKKTSSSISALDDPRIHKIMCQDDAVKSLIEHLVLHMYESTSSTIVEKLSVLSTKSYKNDTCNSYDFNDNVLVDFNNTRGSNDVLIVKFNSVMDDNFLSFFNKFILHKHLDRVQLINTNIQEAQRVFDKKLSWYMFNATHDKYHTLIMDDLICVRKNQFINIQQLFKNNLINIHKTQLYMDLFDCSVPKDIEQKMMNINMSQAEAESNKKSHSKFSCEDVNSFSNYRNFRCKNNFFIDISFPFTHPYTIRLSEYDFTTLVVHGETFDDIVPIHSVLTKAQLTRYKVNVDKATHPREHFIDDIYYGIDEQTTSKHVVLTNSVPFYFDATKHVFKKIISGIEETVGFYIYATDFSDIATNYMTERNQKIDTIKLLENDRVFVDPAKLPSGEIEVTLKNLFMFDKINMFHGNVEMNTILKDDQGNVFKAFVIRLFDIRNKSNVIASDFADSTNGGACFDSEYNQITDDNSLNTKYLCEQKTKGNIWDERCRYNYDCPFFQANTNYPNVFGGCNDNGYCEMPKGIIKQSFRKYDRKNSRLICNNCDHPSSNMSTCCAKQHPSPDYMFENDFDARKQAFMSTLCTNTKGKKMLINKYI